MNGFKSNCYLINFIWDLTLWPFRKQISKDDCRLNSNHAGNNGLLFIHHIKSLVFGKPTFNSLNKG